MTHWGTSGPRIVLVHGGAQGSKVEGSAHFAVQQRLASRGFELFVPDRPGHGRSPAPGDGRPDDAEEDGKWVSELLGDGAHLVGHSFGGCVALAAAARRPEAVLSLTLIEPGMQPVALDAPAVRKFLFKMLFTFKLSWSAAARARGFAKLMHIPEDIRGGSSPEELAQMGRAISRLKVPDRAVLERELGVIREAKIPLLVVTGDWSAGVNVTADKVAELGQGRRVTIACPHHFPQLISDEFNELLAGVASSRSR